MKTLIIEDEELACRRLESLIKNYDPEIKVLAKLESVEDSVAWLQSNPHPDLIFLDIHLEDGLSFSIFDQVKVNVPIIFTTAFDEYAIKAFKLKSIDYLLKPITQADLNAAIDKFKDMTRTHGKLVDLNELYSLMQRNSNHYRERFSVSVADKLKTILVSDIAYFFSNSGITFVVLNNNKQYSLDLSLDKLIDMVNPNDFYRVNRQYLVRHSAIANVFVYPKSRLKLDLVPAVNEMVFVSLDKVVEFKRWFDGGN